MTQALLNNLNNILPDNKFVTAVSKDSGKVADFGQIFENKTADSSDYEIKNNVCEENNESITETTQDTKDTTELINSTETLESIIADTELIAAIEYVAENVTESLADNVTEDSESVEDIQGAEKNITEEYENEINTITNEDTTMNKQLKDTLENPTNLITIKPQTFSQTNQNSQNSENENLLQNSGSNYTPLSPDDKATTVKTEPEKLFSVLDPQREKSEQLNKSVKDIADKNIIKDLNIESVSSSASEGSSSEDFMQYQTPQEQAVKVMLQGDIKFEDVKIVSFEKQPQNIDSGKIIEQISKQLEGMYNSSKVNIVLNPESLGRVILKLVNSNEGLLAQFTVTNPETQNLLLKGLAGLKEALMAHGINVDNIVIKTEESELSDGEQNADYTEQEGSKGGNKEQGAKKNKQEQKNFEQMMFEITNT